MAQVDKPVYNVPGGQLSYIKHPAGTVHIQTEFSTYPTLRVITTVILNGAVLFKEAEDWNRELSSDEDRRSADEFLRVQHAKVYEKTLKVVKSQNLGKEDAYSKAVEEQKASDDLIDETRSMSGFKGLTIFDQDGAILYTADEERDSIIAKSAPALAAMAGILSERFNAGQFDKAVFKSAGNGICWVSFEDKILSAENPKPESAIKQMEEIVARHG
ncbi:MAG: hypothetical protein GF307_12340 [candidate division Zixibacteria bacterium]|nr:hypothetical protein [candidate division Zixibacteria bacterium]